MKERYKRIIAIFFVLNLLFEVVSPTIALALTSGPSQPEVQTFTPISTSDMVNLFSGDFNYNIPLMDIDGYPLNLAYNAGVSTDQEASWVGLGWNINPGTVNRNMRGLPDDFDGDQIHKEMNMKANQTFGASFGLGVELFGKDKKKTAGTGFGNLNLSLGLNYNTYAGYGMDMSARLSLSQSKNNADGFCGSLGLNSGTGKGLGITADVSYQKNRDTKEKANRTGSTNRTSGGLGLAYNTVGGLSNLTFNYSFTRSTWFNQLNCEGTAYDDKTYDGGGASANGGFGFNFASPTWAPTGGPEMVNLGLNLSVTFGFEAFGSHPKGTIGAYYSGQFLRDKTKDYKAYGYLHSEDNNSFADPENSSDKLHDFNREKDASFTMNTPNLPVTNYTYDNFNYTGQGISGDFRPYRNQVGTVFDPYVKNFPSLSAGVGVELGAGNLVHGGLNAELSFSRGKSGKWTEDNKIEGKTLFTGDNNGFNESTYFKQGGEKTAETDMNYFTDVINGFEPVRMDLQVAGPDAFLISQIKNKNGGSKILSGNKRLARVRRNESVNVLTAEQASQAGLQTTNLSYPKNVFSSFYNTGLGAPTSVSRVSGTYLQNHHISEITTLRDDGARYVYGIPVYNNLSKDVTFALESTPAASTYSTGLIGYSAGSDNSTGNSKALDNYFESQTMPAYPHSFLLTALLSSDYVDKTQDGPTIDDLGKYTRFNYTRHLQSSKWRMPYGTTTNQASHNQGLYSSSGAPGDDKASYSYGEKEIWYVHSIESKNYVAVFDLANRDDALPVSGENGGKDVSAPNRLQYLNEIRLYSRQEMIDKGAAAVPLKVVHFEYDYSLCPNVHNNVSGSGGKLTLKKVWFTYQNSVKGKLSPYKFEYNTAGATNYSYNPKAYDRWGNYKPNNLPGGYPGTNSNSSALLTSEFPYSEQDSILANNYASAWNLSRITVPSGAVINVTYEADDYAYVQDKRAMQMFTASATSSAVGSATTTLLYDTPSPVNNFLHVPLSAKDLDAITSMTTGGGPSTTDVLRNLFFRDETGKDIEFLYFKFLVNTERNLPAYNAKYEYITGYAKIDYTAAPTLSGGRLIFKFKSVSLSDNVLLSGINMHPVSMAGINFVRKYMPRVAFDNNQDPFSSAGSNLLALANGIKASFTPIVQFFKGGISNALRTSHSCQQFVPERSFVRLYTPRQKKRGGGCRVRQITMADNWDTQSGNPAIAVSTYGQIYDYVTRDPNGRKISSGVASYEPLIGGDENPHRQPLFYKEEHILAPDDDYYHEGPYGETMFPGPSVGYSRVVVRSLPRTAGGGLKVSRHGTGATVHEFYTARDFPTKTDRTDVKKERHKPNPVAKFLKFFTRDFMTTSQGYQVIVNDMHGKPKAQWVYKEGDPTTINTMQVLDQYEGNNYISGVEYKYKRNLDQLTNDVQVIEKSGQISTAMVGVDYDMVMDTRESKNFSFNGNLQGNLEGFFIAIFPGLVPTVFPGYSQQKTRYRSSVITKTIYRYGMLDETIAYDNGSKVSKKNTLWDAETGNVVLTETTNSFDDKMFNLTYPAHWAYDRMGSSAKNIAAQSTIAAGNVSTPAILTIGDEVLLQGGATAKGWVRAVVPVVQIINTAGTIMSLTSYDKLTVIRSGNRNQQNLPVATLVSMVNPISVNGGVLDISKTTRVTQASAIEYADSRGIFCNCGVTSTTVVNPFLVGQAGIFRPSSAYVHLTGREQNLVSNNTNIRTDGPYKTFVPFWTPNPSAPFNWFKTADPSWQYTSRTVLFSQYGHEVESEDALNRPLSAQFGYGHTLPVAISTNARYKQMGFDGFEDYDYNSPCEKHFGFIQYQSGTTTVTYNKSANNYVSVFPSQNQKFSHTGRKSMKVPANATITINATIPNTPPVVPPPACNPSPNTPLIY